jgi:hypothetical protein
MSMVALIDRPNLRITVRHDKVPDTELCPTCHGSPYRWRHIGGDLLRDGIAIWRGPYLACRHCYGTSTVPRKSKALWCWA